MTKPVECPFCKAIKGYYEVDEWDNAYITCTNCGAQGPIAKYERGAYMKALSLWRKAVNRDKL